MSCYTVKVDGRWVQTDNIEFAPDILESIISEEIQMNDEYNDTTEETVDQMFAREANSDSQHDEEEFPTMKLTGAIFTLTINDPLLLEPETDRDVQGRDFIMSTMISSLASNAQYWRCSSELQADDIQTQAAAKMDRESDANNQVNTGEDGTEIGTLEGLTEAQFAFMTVLNQRIELYTEAETDYQAWYNRFSEGNNYPMYRLNDNQVKANILRKQTEKLSQRSASRVVSESGHADALRKARARARMST